LQSVVLGYAAAIANAGADGGGPFGSVASVAVRRAVAATTWCVDHEPIARLHRDSVLATQVKAATVGAHENVATSLARMAACEAIRRVDTAFGQDGYG